MPRTGFQLLDISPWPIVLSSRVLGLTRRAVATFSEGICFTTVRIFFVSFSLFVFCLVRWWSDVVVERTFLGAYRSYVVRNLQLGIYLFILSEVFFFVRFFWAFFNSRVGELSMQGVGCWPPLGVKPVRPWGIPLLNTAVLLSSAITVTWAHKAIMVHNKKIHVPLPQFSDPKTWNWRQAKAKSAREKLIRQKYQVSGLLSLGITIILGITFSGIQIVEYYWASFCISDGVYGSRFYLLTGFHGAHVVVGTIFLIVCWFRLLFCHFSYNHFSFGLTAAVLYWHFVDVVWIIVIALVYIWGF